MINAGRVKETILTFINRLGKMITPLKRYYKGWAPNPKIWILLGILLAAFLLFWYPQWRVSQFGITSPKDLAEMENSYRVTLAQILGGIAVAISLYYTWRRINISQDGQLTDRFTRAVDQLGAIDHLGNPAIEIRLGGIYALERIANESNKDYWPIMEILTAYVRKNSIVKQVANKTFTYISMDIQANETTQKEIPDTDEVTSDIKAVLTVIRRRKGFFNNGEDIGLDLQRTQLRNANLFEAHLQGADLSGANLEKANLEGANLEGANLERANLEGANLDEANLFDTNLIKANLSEASLSQVKLWVADLSGANLTKASLSQAELSEANLSQAKLSGARLSYADLEGANLSYADLDGANLSYADLDGVDLSDASLFYANLFHANLVGAHLDWANLSYANLSYANLSYANLQGADLSGANLEKANLEGANLDGVYLSGDNLEGANLEEAKNLSFDQLSKVKTLYGATIDDELLIPLKERYTDLFEPHYTN